MSPKDRQKNPGTPTTSIHILKSRGILREIQEARIFTTFIPIIMEVMILAAHTTETAAVAVETAEEETAEEEAAMAVAAVVTAVAAVVTEFEKRK